MNMTEKYKKKKKWYVLSYSSRTSTILYHFQLVKVIQYYRKLKIPNKRLILILVKYNYIVSR